MTDQVVMSADEARLFAKNWVADWNRRDVEAVLAHYADDAVFVSPKAEHFTGKARVNGKVALRAYWQTALANITSLTFTLQEAFWSASSQTLIVLYRCELGSQPPVRVAEVMQFRGEHVVHGEGLYGAPAL